MPVIDLETTEIKEPVPGYRVRFVHSDNITLAFWDVKAGSVLPAHSHVHEQLSQITEGEFELTIAGNAFVLTPGKIAIIPPNIEHSGRAITDCKITDTFYPVREDYL
ncbi:MAG: cupin domain-containing protein [Chlorobi bacterium]|nr:cupin domain-containing protein [Chlorobiota bacterium]